MKARTTELNTIAREALGLDTLDTRKSDRLDFHEHAVWAIREALERAYDAGRKAPPPRRTTCPACTRDIEIRPL